MHLVALQLGFGGSSSNTFVSFGAVPVSGKNFYKLLAAGECILLYPGRPVQVDAVKPTLTAPVTKRLKLTFADPLLNLAFKCNLRRYTPAGPGRFTSARWGCAGYTYRP